MLKKWLDSVFSKRKPHNKNTGERYPYPLDIEGTAAESVLKRLHRAGYQGYLVGGAVRDLLLGMEPKDFDVATDATPEEVRKIFRRSRIIGRRFQIVHVMVGAETIEVSTFRSGGKVRRNEHGRIMNDNAYGTLEQDALRRDFTCNALYYNPARGEITDFHHGVADIRAKRLVMIGDARARYQEDPVRMLRAARLSGKLGFQVAPDTAAPIAECLHLLPKEPLARLFDEVMKLLFSGAAIDCLKQMQALGMDGQSVHPLLACALERLPENQGRGIVALALNSTDSRLRADQGVSVGFVLAAVLWPQVREAWQRAQNSGLRTMPALSAAVAETRAHMEKGWGVPHRFTASMREIWQLQPQFEYRRGARPFRLLAQPRFRAAYDFLLLRARAGEVEQSIADWWTAFQEADEEQRKQMIQAAEQCPDSGDAPAKKRRRRRKKKTGAADKGAAE